MTDANDYPIYIDRRDAAVVKQLEKNKVYGAAHIERLYKQHTDIRQNSTSKQRKNNLFESPCMKYTGTPGNFEFVGFEDE